MTEENALFSLLPAWLTLFIRAIPFLKKCLPQQETIATRFLLLFEQHGIYRNQIPRLFGHGLTLADVQDAGALLPRLSDELLDAACELFAVQRDWLDGANPAAYAIHDFYKQPKAFQDFIADLKQKNDGVFLLHVVLPERLCKEDDALLVLAEPVSVGDREITRYHLCDVWRVGYWKSRAYLAACIAIALKQDVVVRGCRVPAKTVTAYASGERLFCSKEAEGFALRGQRWNPESWLNAPEAFLEGVDPELEGFGTRAALGLWLELAEAGWMDTGLDSTSSEAFKRMQAQA